MRQVNIARFLTETAVGQPYRGILVNQVRKLPKFIPLKAITLTTTEMRTDRCQLYSNQKSTFKRLDKIVHRWVLIDSTAACGKTSILAALGLLMHSLGCYVAVCAPTNVAVEVLDKKLTAAFPDLIFLLPYIASK